MDELLIMAKDITKQINEINHENRLWKIRKKKLIEEKKE